VGRDGVLASTKEKAPAGGGRAERPSWESTRASREPRIMIAPILPKKKPAKRYAPGCYNSLAWALTAGPTGGSPGTNTTAKPLNARRAHFGSGRFGDENIKRASPRRTRYWGRPSTERRFCRMDCQAAWAAEAADRASRAGEPESKKREPSPGTPLCFA
jgi:hypothetical protein